MIYIVQVIYVIITHTSTQETKACHDIYCPGNIRHHYTHNTQETKACHDIYCPGNIRHHYTHKSGT